MVNPLLPFFPFLHPLKVPENHRFSDVFRGYKREHKSLDFFMNFCWTDLLEKDLRRLHVAPEFQTSGFVLAVHSH